MTSLRFDPDIVPNCPPNNAKPASGILYKVTKGFPPEQNDFDSDVERKAKNHDPTKCDCWGCSVWVDAEGVNTGLNLFQFWKRRHVVAAHVCATDGVLKHTPSNSQPRHHTFWKTYGIDIVGRCTVHRYPDKV